MNQQVIPCSDCEDTKDRLELFGFTVQGCIDTPGRPGFCTISFDRLTDAVARIDPTGGPAAEAVGGAVSTKLGAGALAKSTGIAGGPIGRTTGSGNATITTSQAATARAIVNIFETSSVLGRYGQVTLIPGDTGRLTFGRSQTTLGSGNLHLLLAAYCANPGARFRARIAPFLSDIAAQSARVDHDLKLHNVLRASADDPVMRELQDEFFDQVYWQPAVKAAARVGIRSPLGHAVVYDSHVHGSWGPRRDEVLAQTGSVSAVGEAAWIGAYIARRRAWLESSRPDLRKTVYRMDSFKRLIELGLWGLPLPLVVRDIEISQASLAAAPSDCYDGPEPGSRSLAIQQPLARGLDVRLLQLGLSDRGIDIKADGVFGPGARDALKAFQAASGLPVNGIADVGLIATLVG